MLLHLYTIAVQLPQCTIYYASHYAVVSCFVVAEVWICCFYFVTYYCCDTAKCPNVFSLMDVVEFQVQCLLLWMDFMKFHFNELMQLRCFTSVFAIVST